MFILNKDGNRCWYCFFLVGCIWRRWGVCVELGLRRGERERDGERGKEREKEKERRGEEREKWGEKCRIVSVWVLRVGD